MDSRRCVDLAIARIHILFIGTLLRGVPSPLLRLSLLVINARVMVILRLRVRGFTIASGGLLRLYVLLSFALLRVVLRGCYFLKREILIDIFFIFQLLLVWLLVFRDVSDYLVVEYRQTIPYHDRMLTYFGNTDMMKLNVY